MADRPQFREVIPSPRVPDVLTRFSDQDGLILLESARRHDRLGRYSFLAANPIQLSQIKAPKYNLDPFEDVRSWSNAFEAESVPDLPPFQGGFAGLLAYDLGRCWERLPSPINDELQLPACVIGMYDWVIAWDHLVDRCWVIAHGFDPSVPRSQKSKALETIDKIFQFIHSTADSHDLENDSQDLNEIDVQTCQYPFDQASVISSNFSEATYCDAVQTVINYIVEGDIFQANLSQRLISESTMSVEEIYFALRKHNSAPFAGLFKHEDWAVLSSSPERFLQKVNDQVWTRPIKGTRQRRPIPEADLFTRDELRQSEKDQAENVMIVDLLRNDLSRVCRPGTIRVPELCSIETYETVTHLVSEVTGQLREGTSFWDVLEATFPGGSITGAPKIRAMEIITELEQVARGPYCGSLFYCGFDGTADSNILIRTISKRGNRLMFPVGGGVVAQSNPKSEYEETLHKAEGIRNALEALAENK